MKVIEPWNEQTPRNLANGLPPAPWGYSRHGRRQRAAQGTRSLLRWNPNERGGTRSFVASRPPPFCPSRAVATVVSDSSPSGNCVPNMANMIVPRDYVTKGEENVIAIDLRGSLFLREIEDNDSRLQKNCSQVKRNFFTSLFKL